MKKRQVSFEVLVYDSFKDLPSEDQHLMTVAIEAREKAYAPYSNFYVGAAVYLSNGRIISGNNQENAAYPSGLCAERVTIFYAASQYPQAQMKRMAISASSQSQVVKTPVAPCGNCRQTLAEYENKQQEPIEILFMGQEGQVIKCNSISNLLPFAFDGSLL
ncbi:cytidine deaminase [Arenibacter sp. GZD96]|uniref:cytidine deaminase n=1 Tax=Aurantibrevibacter litoralis TaxID=3106030 RepID=UPI002AFE0FC3|nr:cytidine deaminase [Arenibacter sp. GZD-96]MEA1785942.1 cytidine deaminase [Arenibacter sp. GZD-96]